MNHFISRLQQHQKSFSRRNNFGANENTGAKPRLAPMKIAKFNGKIEKYLAFRTSFNAPDLEDPALELLQTVKFSLKMYVCKLSIDRYTNKRVIDDFTYKSCHL